MKYSLFFPNPEALLIKTMSRYREDVVSICQPHTVISVKVNILLLVTVTPLTALWWPLWQLCPSFEKSCSSLPFQTWTSSFHSARCHNLSLVSLEQGDLHTDPKTLFSWHHSFAQNSLTAPPCPRIKFRLLSLT